VKNEIPLQLSKGKLPDLVFEKFKKYGTNLPNGYLRETFIRDKLKTVITSKTLHNSIHTIVHRWHKAGFLEKNPRGLGYRLKKKFQNLKQRPLVIVN